ncbi:hypothetical protein FNAPI_1362 [Fusarium napiforme]|uniref:Uncharacterized protein n=1 Tax=Fusarium napiforme TaxID=42672 RepID=A0A8H5K467_9HYPO|nr:hypothetical protein FNAPI_1362 [Fusarium napiforme]
MPSNKRNAFSELSNNAKTKTLRGKKAEHSAGKEILPQTDDIPGDQEKELALASKDEFNWEDDDDEPALSPGRRHKSLMHLQDKLERLLRPT